MDVVNIKMDKVGGLSTGPANSRPVHESGITVTIEDMPGNDITGATILIWPLDTGTLPVFGDVVVSGTFSSTSQTVDRVVVEDQTAAENETPASA